MSPSASLIIRAKDEADGIARTLAAVRDQTVKDVELIVVDSGSLDDTTGIAHANGALVIEIPARSFTFGGSLNRGCQAASGEILVALSAHARPTDDRWLERLLEPFDDPRVACAAGTDRGPDGQMLTTRILQDAEMAARHPNWGYSSAAGAFRADLWRKRAFRADMPGTEDKEWAWHWLERGYLVAIDSAFDVAHDHSKDSLRDQYDRARREWVGFGRFVDVPQPRLEKMVERWWHDQGTYRSLARARLSHRRLARLAGEYAGRRTASRMDRHKLRLVVMADSYPVLSETFVTTEVEWLVKAGHDVRVEALTRPDLPGTESAAPVRYMVDESLRQKLVDATWLAARHPLACLRDAASRRAWASEEDVRPLRALAGRARRVSDGVTDHLHVHFADASALDALRIARILGVPYSVTAHAYDIFLTPRNLKAKLDEAAFSTTGCEYNARYLRDIAEDPGNVHVIVMGVDTERFRRTRPYPGGAMVLAIGRLVEKKGFAVLVEAAATLRPRGVVDRVVIVGNGPLRDTLEARSSELGAGVEFLGARTPSEIREQLEDADLLAMPCVVAPDGDRDSMPVVVKEALAVEVPVVASHEVGLPEVVKPDWGRTFEPGDAPALVDAVTELMALPVQERAAMGSKGRSWVVGHCNAGREAAKLIDLVRCRAVIPEAGREPPVYEPVGPR